ncbi:MAG: NAD(P)H-dependent glycerol-3-phosphate dehydrogenase, partial [Steroidobacteraceae bacterium]
LVLTCTDDQSRNRRFGKAVASGRKVEEAIRDIGQVVEGYHAARAVRQVATRLEVDMPICEQVYRVTYEGLDIAEVVDILMSRAVSAE